VQNSNLTEAWEEGPCERRIIPTYSTAQYIEEGIGIDLGSQNLPRCQEIQTPTRRSLRGQKGMSREHALHRLREEFHLAWGQGHVASLLAQRCRALILVNALTRSFQIRISRVVPLTLSPTNSNQQLTSFLLQIILAPRGAEGLPPSLMQPPAHLLASQPPACRVMTTKFQRRRSLPANWADTPS
jgi:hypothetical protein